MMLTLMKIAVITNTDIGSYLMKLSETIVGFDGGIVDEENIKKLHLAVVVGYENKEEE